MARHKRYEELWLNRRQKPEIYNYPNWQLAGLCFCGGDVTGAREKLSNYGKKVVDLTARSRQFNGLWLNGKWHFKEVLPVYIDILKNPITIIYTTEQPSFKYVQ